MKIFFLTNQNEIKLTQVIYLSQGVQKIITKNKLQS